jgi:cellulose synthase/poly-beta-1,6-N-acetylglucosamine synthase-like glycosyltransferase
MTRYREKLSGRWQQRRRAPNEQPHFNEADEMLILFVTCLAIVAYVYFGYPFLLWRGILGHRISIHRGDVRDLISIIVPAHNEEAAIEAKLRNLFESDFPRGQFEILIGSDGSSDRTEDIVRQFESDGVGLVSFPQQHGKSSIQNGLVAVASGSILVFTDADCLIAPDALRCLVENFADSRVGLVTGCPRFSNSRETNIAENESSYLRYETWLRERESECGLLAMASGSLFAVRRSLWQPLPSDLGDDFALPLRVAKAGMLNVLDSRAVPVTRLTQNDPEQMLRMKARIISKDFRALLANVDLLNPIRHGTLAISLWSHKLLRWLVPFFLIGLFVSNLRLLNQPIGRIAFAAQVAFYAVALAGVAKRERALGFPWSVPASFCIVNAAAFIGVLKCVSGRTSGQWKPARGSSPAAQRVEVVTVAQARK